MDKSHWSFADVWNKSLENVDAKIVEPRNYLWASDLGKPHIDVFLKMKGVVPTNPPNPRSLRKFEAGNVFEWIVQMILLRSGLMQATQERVEHTYDGLLRVSGKIDFIAGGMPEWEKAREELATLGLPERTQAAMEQVVEYLHKNYPGGLDKKALEIKSVSSHMMNALEITEKPLDIHALQAYHYTKHPEIERADVVYICRDDMRMMEFPIIAGMPSLEEKYRGYIEVASKYYQTDTEPPKAEPVVWEMGKFTINRQIGWSPYLTLMYGFEDQMAFEETHGKTAPRWNRVIKRMKNGDKMTAQNLEIIEEMKAAGWNPDELVAQLVDTGEEETE